MKYEKELSIKEMIDKFDSLYTKAFSLSDVTTHKQTGKISHCAELDILTQK